jgi:hypothetical protein
MKRLTKQPALPRNAPVAGKQHTLAALYQPDEIAWLEQSSRQIRAGRVDEFDYANLESATLRRHAKDILAKSYKSAVAKAARETRMPPTTFPAECPYTLEPVLTEELA